MTFNRKLTNVVADNTSCRGIGLCGNIAYSAAGALRLNSDDSGVFEGHLSEPARHAGKPVTVEITGDTGTARIG